VAVIKIWGRSVLWDILQCGFEIAGNTGIVDVGVGVGVAVPVGVGEPVGVGVAVPVGVGDTEGDGSGVAVTLPAA
jgi:hypothetical protein